jgi:hypothetical protein
MKMLKKERLGITFGAMADPLRKQLEMTGIDAGTINHFQRDADAIVRLNVRSLLTDSETRKARLRVVKKFAAELRARGK